MLPSPDTLNDFEHGKFVLSNLAAKRAKQLREGAPPLVNIESNHPLTIALAEIAAGKIKPVLSTALETGDVGEGIDRALVSDEPLPAELGMLLPALDETEVALVAEVLGEDEHDHDHEAEEEHDGEAEVAGAMNLSDLVGEEEEETTTAPASEDDTLSLSDIAEQEMAPEDEESEE